MAKYVKGKKLPKGISQRKDDGKFVAGFVDKSGKRHQRRFDTIAEADKWLYDMRHEDKFGDGVYDDDMTVNDWYKFWHTELIKDLAANTRRNYAERYERNIKPVIGKMRLKDVKPMHCTKILNSMDRYVHVTDDSMENGIKLFEQVQLEKGLAAESVEGGAA